jgi:hypothetical protein
MSGQRDPASRNRRPYLHPRRQGVGRGEGEQRAGRHTNEGQEGVPDQIEGRHLVSEELDEEQPGRGDDDPPLADDGDWPRQHQDPCLRQQAKRDQYGRQIQAGGKTDRNRQRKQSVCREPRHRRVVPRLFKTQL